MTLDVDKFDEELERLREEAKKLETARYIEKKPNETGQYILTEIGELYLFQKILGPLIKAKEKDKVKEIIEYLQNDKESLERVKELLDTMNTEHPVDSLRKLTDKIISNAMPWINAIDKLHQLSGKFGLF